jgi:hypothetical protein
MTIKFALKAGCAALALAGMASANAGLFYVDIGQTFTAGGVTSTSTAIKNEMTYKYDSSTTILDTNLDGKMSAGDLLTTNIGLAVSGKTTSTSAVTNFVPIPSFSGDSNNGYGAPNWILSFGASNLHGIVSGVSALGVPTFNYAPGGVLNLYVQTSTSGGLINFMNIDLTGGGATGVSTILDGIVDFTGISGAGLTYANMFHSGTSTCGGSSGFFDIWTNCGGSTGDMAIQFASTQDTNVVASQFTPISGGVQITSNHNGSATFNIPEPGSLALLGLALAGLGMTQRRRKQV